MNKHSRFVCALIAGVATGVLLLFVEVSYIGVDGLKGLLMASLLGLIALGLGVGAASLGGVLAGLFVYGAIWFVQEAFDLHPATNMAAECADQSKSNVG